MQEIILDIINQFGDIGLGGRRNYSVYNRAYIQRPASCAVV